MSRAPENSTPQLAVTQEQLIPVSDHLRGLAEIPASRMFVINKSLNVYRAQHPDEQVFDASQGDGGASLPGVPKLVLARAAEMQAERGTAYDMPFGTEAFRKSVAERYWKLDAASGWGPANVLATAGGRDALLKAYQAMLALGHGRSGDLILVSRVPWISYNWGPYGVGANVLWAPGDPANGWSHSVAGIRESVKFAATLGRKIAGFIITNPDNPTGLTHDVDQQELLAKTALEAGAAFVLFDWMYHYVTDEAPMDLNSFLRRFTPAERQRLMFLDGITKSLGASNIRNCHLLADERVVKFIAARASHGIIPSYFSMAVAMAAYELGFSEVTKGIVKPTNASRKFLREQLQTHKMKFILGQGYYAFIKVEDALAARGWTDSEQLGTHLAENFGVAVVPGSFFSPHGADWIRFSYATPPERTAGAFDRFVQGLNALRAPNT